MRSVLVAPVRVFDCTVSAIVDGNVRIEDWARKADRTLTPDNLEESMMATGSLDGVGGLSESAKTWYANLAMGEWRWT